MRTLRFAFARLFLLLCLLVPICVSAAGRIEGIVTDVRNGQPVAGAIIELGYVFMGGWDPVTSVSPVQTDAQGRYALDAIPRRKARA